jgi:hypothetical protein
MLTRIKTQEVVGTLKAAGMVASILSKRQRRSGFKVTQFNPVAVAVEFHGWEDLKATDHDAEATKLEAILMAAGYKVSRPFPDKSIIGVTK